jgi:hypothetical protein
MWVSLALLDKRSRAKGAATFYHYAEREDAQLFKKAGALPPHPQDI